MKLKTINPFISLKLNKKGVTNYMNKEEEAELEKMVDRIEKQQRILRDKNKESEYKHLDKKKSVTVHTDDKQALKFWEE